jgi:D-arabinose 1-dehydrogenase-like Zn-dependent alcohol dehydrogenase
MATTRVAVAPMKAAQISKPGGDFEIVEREIPKPGAGHVLIKVLACGVCHSDVLTKEGLWPGIQFPRVPGHEVAGLIEELGEGVSGWTKVSALVSAGTAAMTARVCSAVAAIFAIAKT